MNRQLFFGTAIVALIVGGFFLVAVARTIDTSDTTNAPLVIETTPTPVPETTPPQPTPAVVDDKGGDDDEYEDEGEEEYEDDDDEYEKAPVVAPVPTPAPTPTPTTPAPTAPTPAKNGYTLADIATHDSASSCWMAIRGKVYDVTSFISRHPGGSQILKGCGKDATSYFEGVRGHLKQATLNLLPGFYKGELVS